MPLIHLDPRTGIVAIHGKLGSLIFYTRNGKQYVRRRSIHTPPYEEGNALFKEMGSPT